MHSLVNSAIVGALLNEMKFEFFLQRSFKMELFNDATIRLERALIKTPPQIEQFKDLAQRANEIAIQNIKREVDYSDAPEEFRGAFLLPVLNPSKNYCI